MEAIYTALTQVYTLVLTFFSDVIVTIMDNPMLFVPVLISLAGGLMLFVIGIVRKMGLRGVGGGGRRRRR